MFQKNLDKLNKKHPIRTWWRKNDYKVWRVILFPLYFLELARQKLEKIQYNKMEWREEEAKRIFDKYLPRRVKSDMDEDGSFLVCEYAGDFHPGVDILWGFDTHMTKKDKNYFWKFYNNFKKYLLSKDGYQIEGYKKIHYDDWKEFSAASGIMFRDIPHKNSAFFKKIEHGAD